MSVDVTKMPKLGFGMMRLPEKDGELDLEQICKMVDAYLASGMNYFDTAYMYCGGKSESIVKKALVERHPRESFTLTTKLPQWMMDEGIEGRDRIFNDQLARTGAGYFDYYLLHSVEDGANYEGYVKYDCFNWAKKKKEEGLIKHFGFSFHGTPELLDKILSEHPEVEIVQIQMNYADWDNPLIQSGRLYEVLRKYDMPFLVMEPVKGGSLASAGKEIEAEMKRVHPDASIASWALRFAASLPGVATVLSGMSNEEQMEDNIKTFRNFVPLNEEEKAVIAKAQEALKKSPAVPCTACRYCCDGCPMGIAIPDVFKALNTIRLYGEEDRAKNYYKKLLETSGKVEDCVQCGQCESVCPQHLPIIDLLKELNSKKPVWVELGLQTIHEESARFIRRGYELPVFEDALKRLKKAGITVIVHVILGLPGETTDQMKETVTYLADRPIDGIKLQLLHILKGTDLADVYQTDPFHVFSIEEYIDLVIDCITLLPPRITIHRMTGDGPKNLLIAPLWSGNKRLVLNQLHKRFKERGAWQGQCYVSPLIPAALPFRHPQW